jgi:uncharacterized membrane protein YecN with MAPEG domain
MDDREADTGAEARRRIPWPAIVIGGLALFGAITLVQWILGLAFTLAKLAVVIGVVALLAMFFRGPPEPR